MWFPEQLYTIDILFAALVLLFVFEGIKHGLSSELAHVVTLLALLAGFCFFNPQLTKLASDHWQALSPSAVRIIVPALMLFRRDSGNSALLKKLLPSFFMFACLNALWPALKIFNGIGGFEAQGHAFTLDSILSFYKNVDRLPMILGYLYTYGRQYSYFILVAFFLSALSSAYVPGSRRPIMYLWAVLILHTLFVITVYLSTRQDLAWHLDTAFFRLMFQHQFCYFLIIALSSASLAETIWDKIASPAD